MIDRHPLNSAVAAELSGYLKAAGMTQAQLAEKTDVSEGVIQRYLAGTRDIRVRDIAVIALALDFEPADLWARATQRLVKS